MTEFTNFLTCSLMSLGFTANLRKISVFVDDYRVFHILKKTDEPRLMEINHNKLFTSSVPEIVFTLTAVSIQKALSATANETNGSSLKYEKASTFLRVVTCVLKVNVLKELEREMERSTKKKPPK
ncbi:unnamed protein product [Umbelopsis vinacea]